MYRWLLCVLDNVLLDGQTIITLLFTHTQILPGQFLQIVYGLLFVFVFLREYHFKFQAMFLVFLLQLSRCNHCPCMHPQAHKFSGSWSQWLIS